MGQVLCSVDEGGEAQCTGAGVALTASLSESCYTQWVGPLPGKQEVSTDSLLGPAEATGILTTDGWAPLRVALSDFPDDGLKSSHLTLLLAIPGPGQGATSTPDWLAWEGGTQTDGGPHSASMSGATVVKT